MCDFQDESVPYDSAPRQVLSQLLVLKAEMLRKYFRIEIDARGALKYVSLCVLE